MHPDKPGSDGQEELAALDAKLRIVLPPEYQATYEDVQPVSMGSAGLKFDAAGRVAWDEIWGSFCDLAMAGGPPHKGKLLAPVDRAEVEAEPVLARQAAAEICRGIRLVTDLAVEPSKNPGWVRVMCATPVMAGWLVRAIVMENVTAHLDGASFELPAGPRFRLEKEIKNVVTAVAKTHHYFDGHITASQKREIGALFAADPRPLLQPYRPEEGLIPDEEQRQTRLAASARATAATGLADSASTVPGWLGLECPSTQAAIWMMRALVVSNGLARREDRVLYLPLHPRLDPVGERLAIELSKVLRLATLRGLFPSQ